LATSDILIYKNGSTTQRSSVAGFTLLDTDGIDFDGVTGLHGFSIDLSDNTDAGFYAAGSFYWVVVSTVTIDSQTVTAIAATFRIRAADNTAGVQVVDVSRINNVAATSVTTINANVGTTQPINYTGTGATAYVKTDLIDIAGSAVSTSSAQIGVNVVNAGATAWNSGAIKTTTFTAGAIDAAAIAADAIGSSELAATAASEIATAVWQDAVAGDFTVASSIGKALYVANVAPGAAGGHFIAGANAATTVDITGNLSGSVGSVTGAVGSVTGNVGGNVTGSVGSLATQAKADVNAEVVDTLATDTYAEPGQGTPAATTTLSAKINYLYKAWRNKVTQTSTTYSLFADDATTVDQKATVSDDGTTFTKGETATGP
jgi:hypothetical protein